MSTEITNNAGQSRYEIHKDGRLAGFAEYMANGRSTVFTHTEVDPDFEGQGIGSALAKGALDDVRASGRSVVALCPFIKGYIDRHPDYKDLVAH